MINAQELQGQWNQVRGKVREKWGQLSDDDLTIQGGNVDQLIGKIQQKTGEGREAIEKFLGSLTSSGASTVSQVAEAARGYAQNLGEYASPPATGSARGTATPRTTPATATRRPRISCGTTRASRSPSPSGSASSSASSSA